MKTLKTAQRLCRQAKPEQLKYIEEEDPFLRLFPHRFDWIASSRGFEAKWQTERRYPLSDRLIIQGGKIYGVSFGLKTGYALLDIDRCSPYHPDQDPLALSRILGSLEEIGMVNSVWIQSSYSRGLHLYLPLPDALPTWKVAHAVALVLESRGFIIGGGLLEVFPNRRRSADQLYRAHRLPFQHGSYMIDQDLMTIPFGTEHFVKCWEFCQRRASTTERDLDKAIAKYQRKRYRVSSKAAQFIQDLDAKINPGWTDFGQTNELLGRIAMRGYCFGHCIEGNDPTQPLEGDRLVQYIIQIARSLPGFEEHCRHKTHLYKRAKDWTRSIQRSKYFHYKIGKPGDGEPLQNDWNLLQEKYARTRIAIAVANLREKESLKQKKRDRFFQLKKEKIGSSTLYKNLDLWDPAFDNKTDKPDKPENSTGEEAGSLLELLGEIIKPGKAFERSEMLNFYEKARITAQEACLTFWDGLKLMSECPEGVLPA